MPNETIIWASLSTVGNFRIMSSPKYLVLLIPSFTEFPSGKERSKIILFSSESFLSLVFNGLKKQGLLKGLSLKGPNTALHLISLSISQFNVEIEKHLSSYPLDWCFQNSQND